jgi:hypothetical protein
MLLLASGIALTACGQATTEKLAPAPAPAAAAADLQPFVGHSYTDLATAAETQRYAVANLGLSEEGSARFARAMSLSAPAWTVEGAGIKAFVVVGCEAGACPQAAGILAIDTETGEAYAAVRDAGGQSVLIPNDRLQALVEATSPADRWADPEAWAEGAPDGEAPT